MLPNFITLSYWVRHKYPSRLMTFRTLQVASFFFIFVFFTNEITMHFVFRKAVTASQWLLSREIDRQWEISNLRTSDKNTITIPA